MAYRQSEAYDLSRFEPQVIEQPGKKKTAEPKRAQPPKRAPRKVAKSPFVRLIRKLTDKAAIEDEREMQSVQIHPGVIRTAAFVLFCSCLLSISIAISAKNYAVQKEIAQVNEDIDLAKDENVRLSAQHSSLTAVNRIEYLAEDVLGMVKVNSQEINHFSRNSGDEITLSGDKSVSAEDSFVSKFKELVAYIFA